jgi:hypothetical protein
MGWRRLCFNCAKRLAFLSVLLLLLGTAAFTEDVAKTPKLFATEIQAKKDCPADTVVWVNTTTGIYHFKGMRWYGNTASGAYVCQSDGNQTGYRSPVFCRYCSRMEQD